MAQRKRTPPQKVKKWKSTKRHAAFNIFRPISIFSPSLFHRFPRRHIPKKKGTAHKKWRRMDISMMGFWQQHVLKGCHTLCPLPHNFLFLCFNIAINPLSLSICALSASFLRFFCYCRIFTLKYGTLWHQGSAKKGRAVARNVLFIAYKVRHLRYWHFSILRPSRFRLFDRLLMAEMLYISILRRGRSTRWYLDGVELKG